MINEAIQAILSLLKLRKDAKKTDLEIEKLEAEKKQKASLIQIASLDDIKKYDPRVKAVHEAVKRSDRRKQYDSVGSVHRQLKGTNNWLAWAVVIAIVLYVLLFS